MSSLELDKLAEDIFQKGGTPEEVARIFRERVSDFGDRAKLLAHISQGFKKDMDAFAATNRSLNITAKPRLLPLLVGHLFRDI